MQHIQYYILFWLMVAASFTATSQSAISVQYQYDNLHRLSQETYSNGIVVQYTYDLLGNRSTKVTSGVCASPIIGFTQTANNLTVSFNNVTSNAISYSWDFGNGQTSTQQNPSITYATAGVYNVCLTATNACGSNQYCQQVAVCMITANASLNTVCQGGNVTLNGSGANSYAWNNGVQNGISFVPSVTQTYTVTGTDANGCTDTDNITVTVNPSPNVTANASSIAVCQGGNVTLTGNGANSYTWNNGVQNGVSFVPNVTQTYTVTGIGANGCTDTDNITITVNPLPTVTANASSNAVCQGGNVTLIGNGANSYSWNNGVQNGVSFVPSVTQTYTVTGTAANGCTDTDNITITVNSSPNVIANASSNAVCQGGNVTLTGNGANSYNWNNGIQNGVSFVPTVTQTYTVTGTAANGCTDTDNITITVNPLPTVTANASSITVCQGANVTLTGNGANSYTWNNGVQNGISFVPATTQTYTVTGTAANGCTDTDNITITVSPNPAPTVTIFATSTAVCQGGNVTLIGGGANTYSWNNGVQNGVPFVPSVTQTYTVIGTDGFGCTNTNSITITVNSTPVASITANGITTICMGDTLTVTTPLQAGYTYQWRRNNVNISGATNNNYGAYQAGAYTVIVTNSSSCSDTSTAINVSINPLPLVGTNSSGLILCQGDSLTLWGTGAITYAWQGNIQNGVGFIPNGTATYWVTGTDINGCSNTASITILVDVPPVVANASSNPVCQGDNVTLYGNGASSYTWDNGVQNGVSFMPINGQTYTVTGTNANGCTNTANITITVNPLPTVIANASSNTVCQGGNVTLNGSGATSYSWNNGVQDGIAFVPNITQTYTVTGTDANGCKDIDNITITVNPLPTPLISQNGSVLSTTQSYASYQWYLNQNILVGETFATYIVVQSGNYSVQVTDSNSCSNTSVGVDIILEGTPNIDLLSVQIYPNPFTDILDISLSEQGDYLINVYDLSGKLVASKNLAGKFIRIQTHSLANATYMVEVVDKKNGQKYSQMVVKKQ